MLGHGSDRWPDAWEVARQRLHQPLSLVVQAGDRRVGLQSNQLPHQSVLLWRQLQPEAAIDVLNRLTVAQLVHGTPPPGRRQVAVPASAESPSRPLAALSPLLPTEVRN